jgi:hypothetical protein
LPRIDCIAGSPSLPLDYAPLLNQAISALAGTGVGIAVTCAAGVPGHALVAAAGLGCLAAVFAIGDAQGAGFWAGSSPFCNLRTFGRGRVHWLAGGTLIQPLPVRLYERNRACLRFCAESAPAARVIVLLDRPDCAESLAMCQLGMSLGLGVIAFPCGFEATAMPELAPGGHWAVAGAGVWSLAGVWVPPRPTPPPAMPRLPSMEDDAREAEE